MGDLYAILTTDHGCPQPGSRWLIAMPTATTNPHGVGRIVTAAPHGEFVHAGRRIPRFLLTISVESDDDAAARHEFQGHMAIDCYRSLKEAKRWHAVDHEHVDKYGYGRNHWLGADVSRDSGVEQDEDVEFILQRAERRD